jgi:hypothetical protein
VSESVAQVNLYHTRLLSNAKDLVWQQLYLERAFYF